jgi:hypothetical protein
MAHSYAIVTLATYSYYIKGIVKHEFACYAINTTTYPNGYYTNYAYFIGIGSCSFLSATSSSVTTSCPPPSVPYLVISTSYSISATTPCLVISMPYLVVSMPYLVISTPYLVISTPYLVVSMPCPISATLLA